MVEGLRGVLQSQHSGRLKEVNNTILQGRGHDFREDLRTVRLRASFIVMNLSMEFPHALYGFGTGWTQLVIWEL